MSIVLHACEDLCPEKHGYKDVCYSRRAYAFAHEPAQGRGLAPSSLCLTG